MHPEPVLPGQPLGFEVSATQRGRALHELRRRQRIAGAQDRLPDIAPVLIDRANRAAIGLAHDVARHRFGSDQPGQGVSCTLADRHGVAHAVPADLPSFGRIGTVEAQVRSAGRVERVAVDGLARKRRGGRPCHPFRFRLPLARALRLWRILERRPRIVLFRGIDRSIGKRVPGACHPSEPSPAHRGCGTPCPEQASSLPVVSGR
jgi:hypothetical protein